MARWRLHILSLVLALYLLLAASSSVFASTTITPDTTGSAQRSFSFLSPLSPSPTVTATLTPTAQSTPSNNDLSIWLAFAGVILAALIGAGAVVYSNRRTAKLQKELIQSQKELQDKLAKSQKELVDYQKKVEDEQAEKERQRRNREMSDEQARKAVEQAQTTADRVEAYRTALSIDPRISQLQILGMPRPLDMTKMFVQVKLHEEPKLRYQLDSEYQKAAARRDPNELLRAERLHLEQRINTATTPEQAIMRYKRSVFIGDPGAGKTTLLKYLALKSAAKQLQGLPDFPIHIELNAFVSSGNRDLLDFASTRWEDRYGFPKGEARKYMEKSLRDGTALLLLDALDETMVGTTNDEAESSYTHVSDAIQDIATRFHQSPIVVTARKAGYYQHARLTGFTELEVLEFRQQDIELFIKQWFDSSLSTNPHISAQALIHKLLHTPRLQRLAANPLLLSLITIVYEDQLELPEKRTKLYEECVATLLSKWDTSRKIVRRRAFAPEQKLTLLKEIAWHFHQQGQRYVEESELLKVIADYLPTMELAADQNKAILDDITDKNGLLKEQAHHWYGFLHLTLQEYFVALHISERGHINELLKHIGDSWWEEVTLLYAGQVPDASLLLQTLLGDNPDMSLPDDLFHTNLLLAGRCLAARPRSISNTTLREIITNRLFDVLIHMPYDLDEEQTSEVLTEIGGTRVNTQLLSLLSQQQVDLNVRGSIAAALGTLGDRSIVPDLMRLLSDEQVDLNVRGSIAAALGTLGDRSIVPDLMRLLSDEQVDSYSRGSIADALGTLGDRSIVPDLMRLLSDEQVNSYSRGNIAAALGTLGDDTNTVYGLASLLKDPDIADSIYSALWKICRRMKVRVYITNQQGEQHIEVVPMEDTRIRM